MSTLKDAAVVRAKRIKLVLLGLASTSLYILLYIFNDDLKHIGQTIRGGEKVYFLVPIVIAFVFSFVHGAFTGHFWDVLGMKAKPKK
jgi:hypothetical protein